VASCTKPRESKCSSRKKIGEERRVSSLESSSSDCEQQIVTGREGGGLQRSLPIKSGKPSCYNPEKIKFHPLWQLVGNGS